MEVMVNCLKLCIIGYKRFLKLDGKKSKPSLQYIDIIGFFSF